jgi:ParB family transcriptional regulator, chromosome partitioning protein
MGHARALITAVNPAGLAKQVVKEGLSVRQTEQLAKAAKSDGNNKKPSLVKAASGKDADTRAFENELSTTIGLKVELDTKSAESGILKIHYKSLDQLDDICARINNDS